MIARCDNAACSYRGAAGVGQRYTPPLSDFVCCRCGGPLRAKRRGESEGCIVSPARREGAR